MLTMFFIFALVITSRSEISTAEQHYEIPRQSPSTRQCRRPRRVHEGVVDSVV